MEYYALAREIDGILCPRWGDGWNIMPSLGRWMEYYALADGDGWMEYYALAGEMDGILCPRWGDGWNTMPSQGRWMEYYALAG